MSRYTVLPIPVDDHVPEGYQLILAYAKDDHIVIPMDLRGLPEDDHNCDWEGCCTLSHVLSISPQQKYELERLSKKDKNEKTKKQILSDLKNLFIGSQFDRVTFEKIPDGCFAAYDYNSEDAPITFGEANFHVAKQFPPRVLIDFIEGNIPDAIEGVKQALLTLEPDFCENKELIVAYRSNLCFGILIREKLKQKMTEHKKLRWYERLIKRS